MRLGPLLGLRPTLNSVIAPVSGSMRPMRPGSAFSVNQRLSSGPATMSVGALLAVKPVVYSATRPPGVMRPIAPAPPRSVNQTLPSGPVVIPVGWAFAVSAGNSVTVFVPRSKRAICPVAPSSVNQTAPSAVRPPENSVMVAPGVAPAAAGGERARDRQEREQPAASAHADSVGLAA